METKNGNSVWHSDTIFRMVFLTQCIGLMNVSVIPITALLQGATGYTIMVTIIYMCLGIPLIYMESIVGQFTERDCIDVWKIRPCLNHVGYLTLGYQFCTLIFNHVMTSFILHYLLITFEDPLPYYTCGPWSKEDCNILSYNYTINQECIKVKDFFDYCKYLYHTYPEYQYWKFHILRVNDDIKFYVVWRVCLASGVVSFITSFICFKQKKSLKYVVPFLTIFPAIAMLAEMMGSLQQKGIITYYELAMDLDFKLFFSKFRFSHLIQLVIHNLGIGSGITFNLTSSSSFRTPSFSNSVICVSLSALLTIFSILNLAMMCCPYSYQYDTMPADVFGMPLLLSFVRYPRFIYEYEHSKFYLITIYSALSVLGIGYNAIIFFNLLEILLKRSLKLSSYPGLTCFCGNLIIFLITIPLLSSIGVKLALGFRRHNILVGTFLALLECLVFVMWYGIHRLTEDVHFMLGIQPNKGMKFCWVTANFILCYAFFNELLHQLRKCESVAYAPYVSLSFIALIVIGILVQLIVALFRRNFRGAFALNPFWGPKSDVLKRSRGMFSAQAMTKEYMYRQYHIQAGIIERQKKSNIRIS